ncbi:MAG: DUF1127 domain-containing protein [Magnetovibrio sp.]|nr:DUF1127 domain-containing protein [Magnetovibrio sp.]
MTRHNCTDTISGTSLSSALPLTWHGWLEDGKQLIKRELKSAVVTITFWMQRSRSRRSLAKLEPHLLHDIGMTQYQARQESEKAFWQD